jgi:hypothetical protein
MDLKHLKTKRQKAQQKHKNESEQLAVSLGLDVKLSRHANFVRQIEYLMPRWLHLCACEVLGGITGSA